MSASQFGADLRRLNVGTIFLFELGDIVGGIDPFFAEAASGTEIARYLDSTKEGCSSRNIISHAKGANFAGYPKDFGLTTLCAYLRISHVDPLNR